MPGPVNAHYPVRNRKPAIAAVLCLVLVLSARCVSGQEREKRGPDEYPARTVYVVQTYYHTGFIIELDREARAMLEFGKRFSGFRYVDIGWGEAVFYQDPEFTICKGARAIFIPSKSVVKVEGFSQDVRNVIALSDRAMQFTMTREQFARICAFINGSLSRDKDRHLEIASVHGDGGIVFYNSPRTYCLFNTCNTWIARGLRRAGLDISPSCVVTARTLFWKMEGEGVSLKK